MLFCEKKYLIFITKKASGVFGQSYLPAAIGKSEIDIKTGLMIAA